MTDKFGLAKLVSWKGMTLRLVRYFTNLGKTTRLAVLARFDSEHVFRVRTLNPDGCSSSHARMHVRVWLHESSFREQRHARFPFFFLKTRMATAVVAVTALIRYRELYSSLNMPYYNFGKLFGICDHQRLYL